MGRMSLSRSDGRDGGTRIDIRVAKPAAEDMERFIALTPLLEQSMRASGEMLVKQLDEAAAQQRAAAGAEPAVPASAGRFVTLPVSH